MSGESRPVALVTGSTSGIGAGIAERLVAAGYFVIIHSRSSIAAGEDLASWLGHARYIQADLSIDDERTRLVHEAHALSGRLDVVINNAGVSRVIPHDDLASATPALWHELYEVNVIAPFRLVAAAEPFLKAAGHTGRVGSVVNVASHAGVRPKGASIPYSASKAALVHVTKLLAASMGPAIRVNAVAPGLVDTPLTADWTAAHDLWRERSPMRRSATPSEIAHAVLALTESDYMTGEVLVIDGGLNLT